MTISDMEWNVNDFVNAAKNVMDAGFNGIEIDASNGNLLHRNFLAVLRTKERMNLMGYMKTRHGFFLRFWRYGIKQVIPENAYRNRMNPS